MINSFILITRMCEHLVSLYGETRHCSLSGGTLRVKKRQSNRQNSERLLRVIVFLKGPDSKMRLPAEKRGYSGVPVD